MDPILLYIIEPTLTYCNLETIKKIRSVDKYFEQKCQNYMFKHFYYNVNEKMLSDPKTYAIYKSIRCAIIENIELIRMFPNIKRIKFITFNGSITDELPPSLTHLTFDYGFNQPIQFLPPTLTHLTFGYSFNQPI